MNPARVAFLGLGIMGGGMARRLLGAGFALTVFNRNRAKAEALAAAGAKVAATAREAAASADVVLCMVADDVASRAMWLGIDGALAGAPKGAIVADCSTLSVGWVHELAQAADLCGVEFVDAPVTGSKSQAAAGELNFLFGGSTAALEKIRPVLAPMSKSITHLGPTGSGALVKLINNFVCGVQAASLAEALALIEHSGLDRAKALSVMLDGAPGSPLVKTLAGRMTASNFDPNFLLKLMAKDLSYAIKEGGARGVTPTTAAAALEVFRRAIEAGHGEQDMSAVIEPLRKTKADESA
jgi:3-hydroxyisobutyrate dehydrogenase